VPIGAPAAARGAGGRPVGDAPGEDRYDLEPRAPADADPAGDEPCASAAPFGIAGGPPAGLDWFGNPVGADGGRPRDPVPCPLCGVSFTQAAALEEHVRAAHRVDPDPGRVPPVFGRLHRWGIGLKFLPLWFVLPANLLLTGALYLAWGNDLQLFSLESPGSVIRTWIVRLSILPTVLVLVWRAVDRSVV